MTSVLSKKIPKKIPRNILLFSMLKLNQEIYLKKAFEYGNYIRYWNEIGRCENPVKYNDLLKRREQYKEFINFQRKEDLYNNIVLYKECAFSKYLAQDAIINHYLLDDTKLLKKALRKESPWMWLKDYHLVYKMDRNINVVIHAALIIFLFSMWYQIIIFHVTNY